MTHQITATSYADLERQFSEFEASHPGIKITNQRHITEVFLLVLKSEQKHRPKDWKINLAIKYDEPPPGKG